MKRAVCGFLSVVLMFSFFYFDTFAEFEDEIDPYVINFTVSSDGDFSEGNDDNTRASGLILSYALSVSKEGTKIVIKGLTTCATDVVKCGFKNLTVQRRSTSSDSWSDYFDCGNVYRDASVTTLSTTIAVASGYQYRVTCKHYAKKSLLVTQTISNTSNIVTVS